jgi:hypothetical protein
MQQQWPNYIYSQMVDVKTGDVKEDWEVVLSTQISIQQDILSPEGWQFPPLTNDEILMIGNGLAPGTVCFNTTMNYPMIVLEDGAFSPWPGF